VFWNESAGPFCVSYTGECWQRTFSRNILVILLLILAPLGCADSGKLVENSYSGLATN
jgi:hypothetical protein